LNAPSNLSATGSAASLTQLKGVGPNVAEKLARLGIFSIQDLLFHLPLRYQDRTRIAAIGSLRPGDEVCIRGEVRLTDIKYGRRRMLLSRVSDGTGFITLRFFHFSKKQQDALAKGSWLHCFGEVRGGSAGLEMVHPEYRHISENEAPPGTSHLTPLYPTTEGLGQIKLRTLIEAVLNDAELMASQLEELLPPAILQQENFSNLMEAVRYVHQPPPDAPLSILREGVHPHQQRLAFEELLAHQVSLRQLRLRHQRCSAPSLKATDKLSAGLLSQLPFALTQAQQRVLHEIERDIEGVVPMQRLVQGDVGSGKTIVAALSAVRCVEAGFQVAIMAPTELLAEQHLANFVQWLQPLGVRVEWLSGKTKGKVRQETLSAINCGAAQVIVGTQALFQEGVEFSRLGLVIIDEQHRFGVHQRLALRDKGAAGDSNCYPHQLVMTATPIPRTLAQTAYADLDVSIIDELPPGRTPVETVVISEQRRDEVVARVHRACKDGRQAYWVCPLVEESENLQCQAAQQSADALQLALPDLRIGLIHGRLKAEQKVRVMQAFKQGDIDLLVATTVIEVGVDVANASLMIIDNAERLGLSQLHQLRGRVGRGAKKSSCVLLYGAALSKTAKARLSTLRETNDGFEVAQRDLELRGPGELLGTRQTGLVNLRIADFQRDQAMIPRIAAYGDRLLCDEPETVPALIQRWLGEGMRYSEV
jgi:ATP-dependent DNA helicase RecG